MRHIYVSDETRAEVYALKAKLGAKNANEVIEYLLFKRSKDGST